MLPGVAKGKAADKALKEELVLFIDACRRAPINLLVASPDPHGSVRIPT